MSTTFTRGENPLKADKLNTAFSERVARSGDAMNGPLLLAHDPADPFEAATKQYVDRYIGVGVPTGAFVGPLPPGNALAPLWWNSNDGQLYVQYNDGSSTQWVVANSLSVQDFSDQNVIATGSTVPRSLENRFADIANVLDFGADPTGVLDSAPAINAAAAVPTVGGGRLKAVYIPAGIYLIKSTINLNKGQALYGDAQGASVLQIDGRFDPGAITVISCNASPVDPGPTIRNLYIYFVQPNDVASRATFKTLAAGGTSGAGGTGIQYPWAIATNGNSGRIQVQSVCITGAWNGINADAACFWIDGLKISAFNIGIAIGGTVAAGVLDWAFVSNVEFWAFGLNTAQLQAVRGDGQTIAMRIGCQNGLTASNIACFTAKIIFTADAVGGWFSFTNLLMDAAYSSISILAAYFLQITNLYSTAGTNGIAPAISTVGAVGGAIRTVTISNWYAHSSSPFPLLEMGGGGDFSIVNAYLLHTLTTTSVTRSTAGILRLSNSRIVAANTGAWTVPLVYQNNTGTVQINNVTLGSGTSSGIAIQINQDNASNLVGFVQLSTDWTNSIVSRANGQYGPWAPTISPTFTGTITFNGGVTGINFGAAVGASNIDLSNHLALYGTTHGIGVTTARVNYVVPTGNSHVFLVGGGDKVNIGETQMTVSTTARFNGNVGFNSTAPIAKPTVSGSRAGNAALASLLTQLAAYGLITDSTSV